MATVLAMSALIGGLAWAASPNDHNHYGQAWGSNTSPVGLAVVNSQANSTSFYGYANGGTNSRGVQGASGPGGIGVQGESFGQTGSTTGVYGTTYAVRGTNL